MIRLLAAKNLHQSNFHIISHQSSVYKTSNPDIKCSFCRKILLGSSNTETLMLSRHQSTKTANAVKSQRKKAKHKSYKKYGELLEVGEKVMTEMQVSISKLKPSHLSKLASSPVSLGQLHQLTAKPTPKKPVLKEVDPELLRSIKEKILKKPNPAIKEINLQDDQCALVYTNHSMANVEDRLKTKQFIDMVKESYYNFRKATIFDQRLQDLRYAINEGLSQEFHPKLENMTSPQPKSPHAVFRELFVDNNVDSFDQELVTHITNMQHLGMVHPAIDDIYDDPLLHSEMADAREDIDFEPLDSAPSIQSLNVNKAKQAIKRKKKEQREKRRARKELSMKQDLKDIVKIGKQDSLHRLMAAHLQLLCSLNMTQEGRQVLQYYRQKSIRVPEYPKVTDVKVYNTLLHGYAAKGQLENMKELLAFMREDGVVPSAQTFAAVFECIERSRATEKAPLLSFYAKEMQEQNITLNDLLDKTKFIRDQRDRVLKAIRRIEPAFEPEYTPPALDYNCPLLDQLKLHRKENRQGLLTSPAEGVLSVEELKEMGRKQLDTEIKGYIEVQNIDIKDESTTNVKFHREKLAETEAEWRSVIREAFTRNLGTLRSQSNASHSAITLYPYLKVLEVDQFVELIMGELSKLVDGSETYSPTLKLLQRDLGTQVYHRYQIEQARRNGVMRKVEEIYAQYCEWYLRRGPIDGSTDKSTDGLTDKSTDGSTDGDLRALNPRQAWQLLMHRNRDGASLDVEEAPWPMEMRQNIGKFLYNIIVNDVKIDVNMFKPKAKLKKLPAVYKVHRPWGRLVRLELKPHPCLARLWSGAARPGLRMRAPLLPSNAPPLPWRDANKGAYLATPTPLIRMPVYMMKQWQRLEQAPTGALYPVLDSLNQLGEVPWRVNTAVLDLQLLLFRSGGNKKLDIPPPASSLDMSQFGGSTSKTSVANSTAENVGKADTAGDAFKRRLAVNRARSEMHSLWCDALYKLSLANHYRDCVFWLPHNMDFRGRVYACPPHLSQLGADTARALLLFATQRPLGKDGLRWLKLHAINLTGSMKKSTVDERLAYVESIMDKILDSADRPLDGEGWWKESEEPWQTLACCMEIAKAVRSPNPEEYMSGFPVHQDGSCNGLQHYAALGGDAAGARAVNLAPDSCPQDVYSAVAALVEEMRERDAKQGVVTAQMLEGFVRRKVIKQTVMTTVYGVTRFGARLQIAKQLKDIDEFPKEQVWACSQYLTTRTFDSLREMFKSTKLIQDWFTDCAKLVSGVCGETVEWVTPLGLPVVQPYYRRPGPTLATAPVRAPLDHHQRPCTMKQRNAFPPNFIHSLDSSHMMLTGLHCQAAGITFVSVHDCFWTHPASTHVMNKICREQFVALHSQPILENLSEFLVKRYSYDDSLLTDGSVGASNRKRVNNFLKKVPGKGDFDLNSVLQSVYFFS